MPILGWLGLRDKDLLQHSLNSEGGICGNFFEHNFLTGNFGKFFEFFWAECGNECVRKVQIERELEELG